MTPRNMWLQTQITIGQNPLLSFYILTSLDQGVAGASGRLSSLQVTGKGYGQLRVEQLTYNSAISKLNNKYEFFTNKQNSIFLKTTFYMLQNKSKSFPEVGLLYSVMVYIFSGQVQLLGHNVSPCIYQNILRRQRQARKRQSCLNMSGKMYF